MRYFSRFDSFGDKLADVTKSTERYNSSELSLLAQPTILSRVDSQPHWDETPVDLGDTSVTLLDAH